ncbi:hypothetical protein [Tsukamurella tyrosinosolvens]|uniref:hypothetical protein n=1 Tax=Tsukamurella tyrosinosolvens TaxID=57704 RepID=UPI000C7F2645|nr:hypothetical protein [Tsukamurella tyrosinosolvens]AUN39980.1 hypothetical protein ASU32_08110 [Tsukamurella tyrosinosolvens]
MTEMTPNERYYADVRRETKELQRWLDNQVSTIRSNPRLTDQGRRQAIAEVTLAAKQSAAEHRQRMQADRTKQTAALERKLWGVKPGADASEVLLMRDANDRASKVDGSEGAMAAMRSALLSGDNTLAKAIARLSVSRGWDEVSTAYLDEHSEDWQVLEELRAIPSGKHAHFADEAATAISSPVEVRGLKQRDLENVIAADEPAAVVPPMERMGHI